MLLAVLNRTVGQAVMLLAVGSLVVLLFAVETDWSQYTIIVYVVVQFYPWFKFYFLLFRGMVIYDNEFKTKGNKI